MYVGPQIKYLILSDFNKNLNVLSSSRKKYALSISTEICLMGGALLPIEICKDIMKQIFLVQGVKVLFPRGKEARGMALANHSHLAPTLRKGYSHTCTSLGRHRNQKERYKTKTEPCQLNTSKTVLMIHY
jgi:hypothetical protein